MNFPRISFWFAVSASSIYQLSKLIFSSSTMTAFIGAYVCMHCICLSADMWRFSDITTKYLMLYCFNKVLLCIVTLIIIIIEMQTYICMHMLWSLCERIIFPRKCMPIYWYISADSIINSRKRNIARTCIHVFVNYLENWSILKTFLHSEQNFKLIFKDLLKILLEFLCNKSILTF